MVLEHDFLPTGFRNDIIIKKERQLIFGTDAGLSVLSNAKTVFMDGTFKVVGHPFVQLFTLRAFVGTDNRIKQVPLLSVLMSRRRAKDYKLVFKAVRKMMCVRYKTIVSDYESAPWRAVRECFPGGKHLGCYFHWSQAVLRHLRCDEGLQNAFQSDVAVRKVCKLLFALPFLPADDIVAVFERI